MKKTRIALNIEGSEIVEQKEITAEVTGEWSSGQKVWTDEEGNQYTLHKFNKKMNIEYFILEAVDTLTTTWNV